MIVAAVVWGMTGPTMGQFPLDASFVLLVSAVAVLLVGLLVVCGLAATGGIVQGNEETRRWARSRSRTNGAAGSGPAQEDHPPT